MALKRIDPFYYLADEVSDLENIKEAIMGTECFVISEASKFCCTSDGRWINQVKPHEDYISREEFEKILNATKVNTTFGESPEVMAENPGSAFGIALNSGESKTIIEAMKEKGIGLYTFWIHKSNPDLPAEVLAKKSSCRGLCCVDTVKDTGWYGWVQLFDHDGYMYTRYIRNSEPTDWRAC